MFILFWVSITLSLPLLESVHPIQDNPQLAKCWLGIDFSKPFYRFGKQFWVQTPLLWPYTLPQLSRWAHLRWFHSRQWNLLDLCCPDGWCNWQCLHKWTCSDTWWCLRPGRKNMSSRWTAVNSSWLMCPYAIGPHAHSAHVAPLCSPVCNEASMLTISVMGYHS